MLCSYPVFPGKSSAGPVCRIIQNTMTTIADYGRGRSTGLEQTAAGRIVAGHTREDLAMTPEDKDVLRRLAERVAAIAATPQMAETRRLWTQINRLEKARPPVFCDPENGWNEIITETQMQCRGKLARRWEMDLRKEIFWGEVMGDDKPVEPYFDVPYTAAADDWGLQAVYHKGGGARLVHLGRRHQGLRHRLEEDALSAGSYRLGNDPRLRRDRQGRVGRSSCPSASEASGGGRWA